MSIHAPDRQPKGAPASTGGQFKAGSTPTADVELPATPAPWRPITTIEMSERALAAANESLAELWLEDFDGDSVSAHDDETIARAMLSTAPESDFQELWGPRGGAGAYRMSESRYQFYRVAASLEAGHHMDLDELSVADQQEWVRRRTKTIVDLLTPHYWADGKPVWARDSRLFKAAFPHVNPDQVQAAWDQADRKFAESSRTWNDVNLTYGYAIRGLAGQELPARRSIRWAF